MRSNSSLLVSIYWGIVANAPRHPNENHYKNPKILTCEH